MIAQHRSAEISNVLAPISETLAALDKIGERKLDGLKMLLQLRQAPTITDDGDRPPPPIKRLPEQCLQVGNPPPCLEQFTALRHAPVQVADSIG